MWWKPKAESDARIDLLGVKAYFRKHPVRGYFAHLHPAYLLPDTEAHRRGVEAAKLVNDQQKLAARVAYLERAVADGTDHLARKELDLLLPILKAWQKSDLYTQAWGDG